MSKTLILVLLLVIFTHQLQSTGSGPKRQQCESRQNQIEIVDDQKDLLNQNFQMVCHETTSDPDYFRRHSVGQNPRFLWIGCSDSRVIPEHMVGAKIGDLFVHRNIANQVNQLDQNAMAVLQYAVEFLKVTNIVVVGHYDCGGIKASLANKSFGHLQSWLSQIRTLRYRHTDQLKALPEPEKIRKLVQINIQEQVRRISRIPIVQSTWMKGIKLNVIGMVYDVETGLLKSVTKTLKGIRDIPEAEELQYE